MPNVVFRQSPGGDSLPAEIGSFDFVMLSAVFEHLLPQERRTIMPLLWSHMRVGAAIFVNQTPDRWHPYEHHSTRLWAINYLPDRAAHWLASRFGRIKGEPQSWEEMLRGGIRGGTERSIRAALTGGRPEDAELLRPTQQGMRDRSDYWLSCVSKRAFLLKRLIALGFRWCDQCFGTIPALNVDVVMRRVR